MSDASLELPRFGDTGWTREDLLDALKNETALPRVAVAIATIYAREIEPDIVATAVALLGLERLSPRVHAAFEEERVFAAFFDEHDYGGLLAAALARPADAMRFKDEDLGYIEDVVEALELFPTEDAEEFPGELEEFPGGDLEDRDLDWQPPWPGMPARNPWRDVGRNDPCPCGSGKKFKKCCLSAHQ